MHTTDQVGARPIAVRYRRQRRITHGRGAAMDSVEIDVAAVQAAVGANITQRRTDLGMSQSHLAASSGVNRPYLHQIEKGEKNPSLLVLVRLAVTLKTTVSQLVRHVEA